MTIHRNAPNDDFKLYYNSNRLIRINIYNKKRNVITSTDNNQFAVYIYINKIVQTHILALLEQYIDLNHENIKYDNIKT